MATEKVAKSSKNFNCDFCHYITSNKFNYDKHLTTRKHNLCSQATKSSNLATFLQEKLQDHYTCENCKKCYKDKTGLWRHKKKCNMQVIEITSQDTLLDKALNKDNLVNYLIKENSNFKELLIEQNNMILKMCETNNTTTIYNNSNNNNKTFNLQVFLNETCKDAMNINDFVDSLKIQLSDLENVGEFGFVNGITNLIVKNLKSLDVTQRPVHCTDSKREVLYIKDENKWEKEGEENIRLRQAIKRVAYKNTKMLSAFRDKHPDCGKSDSKYADQYNKLIIEAMGGRGDNDKEKEDKIIRNIAKEVVIEK
jgi:hypothetical protein